MKGSSIRSLYGESTETALFHEEKVDSRHLGSIKGHISSEYKVQDEKRAIFSISSDRINMLVSKVGNA